VSSVETSDVFIVKSVDVRSEHAENRIEGNKGNKDEVGRERRRESGEGWRRMFWPWSVREGDEMKWPRQRGEQGR
jgi:hypothetical protein